MAGASFAGRDPADVVSPAIAAELVGLRPRGLESLRQRGGGPRYIRAGRRVVYRVSSLLAWLDERERQSTQEGP